MTRVASASAVAASVAIAYQLGRVMQRRASDAEIRARLRREHERYARLLHDRVLQTLETLAVCDELRDTPLRTHLRDEVAWLHELIDQGGPRIGTDLAGALSRVAARPRPAPITVETDLRERPVLPAEVVEALTGATDEALNNVAKHASGTTATITLSVASGRVVLRVTDRGPGLTGAGVRAGYGIRQSIVGRMRAVGGTGRVVRAPGGGTLVELAWTLEASPDQPARPSP